METNSADNKSLETVKEEGRGKITPPSRENPKMGVAERIARAIGSVPSLIAHSAFFVGIFSLALFGFSFDQILLILTTLVSLEAIYLAIFIQMTVNRQAMELEEVQEDIEGIQEDVEDISEDIEDIQENVEEIGEDVEGIQKEVEEISEDVEDIQEDVEDISEDIDKEEQEETKEKETTDQKLEKIESALQSLVRDIEELRKKE